MLHVPSSARLTAEQLFDDSFQAKQGYCSCGSNLKVEFACGKQDCQIHRVDRLFCKHCVPKYCDHQIKILSQFFSEMNEKWIALKEKIGALTFKVNKKFGQSKEITEFLKSEMIKLKKQPSSLILDIIEFRSYSEEFKTTDSKVQGFITEQSASQLSKFDPAFNEIQKKLNKFEYLTSKGEEDIFESCSDFLDEMGILYEHQDSIQSKISEYKVKLALKKIEQAVSAKESTQDSERLSREQAEINALVKGNLSLYGGIRGSADFIKNSLKAHNLQKAHEEQTKAQREEFAQAKIKLENDIVQRITQLKNKEISELESRFEKKIQQVQAKQESDFANFKTSIAKQLEDQKSEMDSCKTLLQKEQKENATLKNSLNTLKTDLSSLSSQYQDIKKLLSTTTVDQKREIETLKSQSEQIKAEFGLKFIDLEKKCKDQDKRLCAQIETFKLDQAEKIGAINAQANNLFRQLKTEIETLEATVTAKSKLSQLEDIEKLRESIADLQKKLNPVFSETELLKKRYESCDKKLEQELQLIRTEFAQNLTAAKNEYSDLYYKHIASLDEDIKKLNQSVWAMRRKESDSY
ncbi:hypothetical protein FGO68_gene3786 [Halteria grandinella]|uniref:Uncharacterized protein n=1 Tax=Halteria grandinella TaxID=5974 RepID=A0A8J8T488_HALGN|nr:hypothetical protein FGO68_gene3786 [Halteria grandinella]